MGEKGKLGKKRKEKERKRERVKKRMKKRTKKRTNKEWNGKKENKERKGKGLLLAVYSRDISRKEFATGERAVRGNCEKVSSWNRETLLDVFSILLNHKEL